MGESNEEPKQNRTKRRPRSSNSEAVDSVDREPPKNACSEGKPSPSYDELQNRIWEHLVQLEVRKNDRNALSLSGPNNAEVPTRGDTYNGIIEAILSLFPGVDENLVGEAFQDLLDADRIYIDQTRSYDLGNVVYRARSTSGIQPGGSSSNVHPDVPIAADQGREEKRPDLPPLEEGSGKWVSNKDAARDDGVKVRTLSAYRSKRFARWIAPDMLSGVDRHGRIWRRRGNITAPPWYLVSSLTSQR